MPTALRRRPLDVDVRDATAIRDWLKLQVADELLLKGTPYPKLLLFGRGYVESLDMGEVLDADPEADAGATLQALKRREGIERFFAVVVLRGIGHDDSIHHLVMLFEDLDVAGQPRRWWHSTLRFHTDPVTGLGSPVGDWKDAPTEISRPEQLPAVLRPFAWPPAEARSAELLEPHPFQPDIRTTYGELPDGFTTPATPEAFYELIRQMVVAPLLDGSLQGKVVVRLVRRAYEVWILGPEQPAGHDDMIRCIAGYDGVRADAIGFAMCALHPNDDPPKPGVQIGAELGGRYTEVWMDIDFPEGPRGPKTAKATRWIPPRPVPAGGRWIGVEPKVEFRLTPIGLAES